MEFGVLSAFTKEVVSGQTSCRANCYSGQLWLLVQWTLHRCLFVPVLSED